MGIILLFILDINITVFWQFIGRRNYQFTIFQSCSWANEKLQKWNYIIIIWNTKTSIFLK